MNKGKTLFGILLGAVALGGGYFIYKQYRKRKEKAQDVAGTPLEAVVSGAIPIVAVSKPRNDNYPLAKGSRGDLVKRLQNAILKLDSSALPKFGADGLWGNETESALKRLNLPTVINSVTDIQNIEKKAAQFKGVPYQQPQQPIPLAPLPTLPQTITKPY